jgi:hypothetical protein
MPTMPALLVLVLIAVAAAQAPPLTLEIRVFNGADEVTPHTRLSIVE